MKGIEWFSILNVFPLLWVPVFVTCYPSAPGTCNMDLMGTIGHGPSRSTCDGCYRFIIEPMTHGTTMPQVLVKIVGTQDYQGLMLMVKDHNNNTVGQFVDYDETLFAPVACDDGDIEEESNAVIGHLDPNIKTWPVQVGWQPDDNISLDEYRVQGMVVLDYDNFHMIPEKPFKFEYSSTDASSVISRSTSSSTAATITTTTTVAPTTTKEVITSTATTSTVLQLRPTLIADLDPEERWPEDDYNPFFLQVVFILMFVYVTMSAILQYILRSRRRKQQERTSHVLQ